MSDFWTAKRRANGLLALLLIGYVALVALFWVGFIASDDVTFAEGAYGWIEQFPFVGGHGTIRYPLTMPMAVSFVTFGGNEVAMALPSLLYMVGALAIGFSLVKRAAGVGAAVFATICAITVPLFMVQGSIANIDMPELFFQMASIALFLKGTGKSDPARWFFAAGVMAGLGFLSRETSVFIAGFYAVLFLINFEGRRWPILWVAAGFLAMWGVELLYLGLMTGDPLYRINIAMHHDSSIDRSIDLAGNFIVHPAIDPLLVLLINQEFMLLFWMAIPAGAWMMLARGVPAEERRLARLLGLYGGVIFVASGAAVTLLPLNPRYFSAPALVAAVLLGMAMAHLWRRHRRLGALICAVLIGSNALGAYGENRHSVFGVRVYAELAERLEHPLRTDPMTHYRAEMLLKWNSAAQRALPEPPKPGTLYLWNPALSATPNARMSAADAPQFARPDGQVIAVMQPGLDPVMRVFDQPPIRSLVPASLWNRLANRHAPVELIRVDG